MYAVVNTASTEDEIPPVPDKVIRQKRKRGQGDEQNGATSAAPAVSTDEIDSGFTQQWRQGMDERAEIRRERVNNASAAATSAPRTAPPRTENRGFMDDEEESE